MSRAILFGLGVGWLAAAVALFFVKAYSITEPAASVICFLAGMSATLMAMNTSRE